MKYPVIVRTESTNQYIAQPLGIPELTAVAATETEAIAQIGRALGEWLASAKLVQISVPIAGDENPWLHAFGRSAHDPDFEEFAEELQRVRSMKTNE